MLPTIPKELEEMIKDIIIHRELEKHLKEQYERELLYAELPCDDYEKEDYRIEICI